MGKLTVVGRVSKLFGLDGGVMINLYDTFPAEIGAGEPLYVRVDALEVPLFPEKFERRGKSGALVAFADIDTPERASEFIGAELMLRSEAGSEMPTADGDLYLEDLVGYRALIVERRGDGSGSPTLKGEITDFIDSELNPLFSVAVNGAEVLIPAADDIIVSVDPDAREIELLLPEGLLELYM